MHPDDFRLQRLLHGDLEPAEAASVREHLAECSDCQLRFAEQIATDQRIAEALSTLDTPATPISIGDIRRAGHQPARRRLPWMRMAAAIVVGLAFAGAAYAAPGSPLPALLRRVIEGGGGERAVMPTSSPFGIAVSPRGELTISIDAIGGAEITVRLDDATGEVSVRSTSEQIVFESDPGHLSVVSPEAGTRIEIVVPTAALLVRIVSAGEPLWVKRDDGVTSTFPLDTAGTYRMLIEPVGSPDSIR